MNLHPFCPHSLEHNPSSTSQKTQVQARAQAASDFKKNLCILSISAALLCIAMIFAIGIGKLAISPLDVLRILWDAPEDAGRAAIVAVNQIRAPRVLIAVIIGGSLSVAGCVLQTLFHNPLVSPDIVGVSSAAAFGGVFTILLGTSAAFTMGATFLFGILAVGLVMLIAKIRAQSNTLTIVLAGVVVSAFFNALVSLIKYTADPYSKLPSITFWLMGSFAAAEWQKLFTILIPVCIGLAVTFALRWRINMLSLGDEDARALGINPVSLRWCCIFAVSLLTAASVATAGIIGWVGLVIPHLVRLAVGHDNRIVLPESFLMGGFYLLLVDTVARTLSTVEIPVGILTATIGAPVFIILLIRRGQRGSIIA